MNFYGSYPAWAQYHYSFNPYTMYYSGTVPYAPNTQLYQSPLMPIQNRMSQINCGFSIAPGQNNPQIQHQSLQDSQNNTPQPIQTNEKRKSEYKNYRFSQKQGRNIFSNIFRQFLRYFFYSKQRSLQIIGSIAKKRKFEMSPKIFYNILLKKKSGLKTYVRIDQIRSFIEKKNNSDEANEFNEIFRILMMIYLKNDHASGIFYSGKVPKSSRRMYFEFGRRMQQMLKG